MQKHRLLLATALVSALAAGPVLAQSSTTSPTQSPTPPTATSSTNNSADRNSANTTPTPNAAGTNPSATTASSSAGAQFWTQGSGNEWRTSKLKGLNVYNQNNEKLGDIDDILVDTSGQIKAVIIGIGGFLGIGDHKVAVPFNQLQFTTNTEGRNMADATRSNAASGNPTATGAGTGLGSPTSTMPGTTASTATPTPAGGNTGALGNRSSNAPDRAVLNATKDQLKNAPEFKYNG